jgi:hypothetical protein
MRASLIISTFAVVVAATPAAAQRTEDSTPAKDAKWSKSSGDFRAALFFTDKPDEFFAAWNQPTPGVELSTTDVAHRGKPIVALVVFTGCGADASGLAESTIRFTAFRPDGEEYGEPLDGELWTDKPPPPKGRIQLGAAYMGIVIEPTDPLGKYKVVAEVVDQATGKTLTLEREFTAEDAAGN